jgi:hypothetical protein
MNELPGSAVSGMVIDRFYSLKKVFTDEGVEPKRAGKMALEQTLIQLKDFGVLNQSQSADVARVLGQAEGGRLKEIVSEYSKGKHGDPIDQINYSNPSTMRVLAAAKRVLKES